MWPINGWRDGGMEGWREGGREGGMEGWRGGGMEGWRDGGMERWGGWRDGGMEGWRGAGMGWKEVIVVIMGNNIKHLKYKIPTQKKIKKQSLRATHQDMQKYNRKYKKT